MKRMIEVWSNVSELTQPPVLHGEITVIGTRMPESVGPAASPSLAVVELVVEPHRRRPARAPTLGYGGTTWSKKPSFSS